MAHSDAETQDRQKTVVAFVAGLLIGGLLVWVFSSSIGSTRTDDENGFDVNNDDSGELLDDDGGMSNGDADDGSANGPTPDGDGSLEVNDQAAGQTVVIADVSYPTTGGWIVVREMGGRILGAARYDTEVGLLPTSVTLLRATETGDDYEVVFYSEDGDRQFRTAFDAQISGTATTVFTAQ